jgi:UDP-glucose 4-epimerase
MSSKAKRMRRILVMGGLGFIGSHLSRRLLYDGYRVRIFDKLYGSKKLIDDIVDRVDIQEGDIEKPDDVLSALEGTDVAIHLIHTTVPGSSMQDPAYDVQSNVLSCTRWLPYMKDTGVKKIIYISSGGTVYGIPKTNPIKENHPTDPISSYGITKLAIEKYVSMYAQLSDVEYLICRPSNIYGVGQKLNIGQGVIGVFLDNALKKRPIEIWGDGSGQRDYLDVEDAVDGIIKLINYNGQERIFNLSTGIGLSLNDILNLMKNELNISFKVKYVQTRNIDVYANILDNSRLRRETGWEPSVNVSQGIQKVFNWFRSYAIEI